MEIPIDITDVISEKSVKTVSENKQPTRQNRVDVDDFRRQIRNKDAKRKFVDESGEEHTRTRSESIVVTGNNAYGDVGEEKNQGDKGLYIINPVPRNRAVGLVQVTCIDCRNRFEVPRALFKKNYSCNDCLDVLIKGRRD